MDVLSTLLAQNSFKLTHKSNYKHLSTVPDTDLPISIQIFQH